MTIVQGVLTSPKSGAVVRGKPFHVKVVTGASGLAFTAGGQVVGDSTVTSGADGSWSVDLPPTSGINPAGTHYALLAFGKSWAFVVPDSGPAQFEDCLVDDPDAPGAVSVGLLPSNNLSDVADPSAALAHLGGISVTGAHSYTDSETARAEAAETAAIATAGTNADTKIATHAAASDPHGDRAFATAADTALKNLILGGVGPAFDTLLELANAEGSDASAITALLASVAANTSAIATKASITQAGPLAGSDGWLKSYAANPDLIIAGAITRDANGAATSAPVVWPDASPGAYTATTVSSAFPGAVDAYTITYGSPVAKTVTQSAVTRDAATGAVTNRPALTVA